MERKPKTKWIKMLIPVLICLTYVAWTRDVRAADKLPQVELSVKPLDFSKPVSTNEIMSAGQLGGQLYPTNEITDKEREKEINNSFGEAIQEWNKHEYKKAIKLFKLHTEKYPDSPWTAEAVLHIGCDAQYTGQYSVAESSFVWIREQYKDKDHDGAKRLVNKATLRLAVLKVSQNNFDEAGKHFSELIQSSDNWRERTYASHWIQRLSRYKTNKLAMLNCGTLALAHVLEKNGKKKEAEDVKEMHPSSLSGYSMQDLKDIAAGYGYELVGLRVSDNEMTKLPLPAIVQLNARKPGDGGHYWVLEKVKEDELVLFDPQAGRRFDQSMSEFAAQWDGAVMVLQANGTSLDIGQRLTQSDQETFYGGCCGVPRPEDDLGPPDPPEPPDPDCSNGAPTWSVNVVNMNLYVADIPMWYESPIGPEVRISLSYNSQSSIAYNQPFGNKWQFNYASYLVVDTGGQATIFMPSGSRDVYSSDGLGGYTNQLGKFNTLTKLAENHFTLRFPDDSVYEYDIPAGTNSLQPFLVKIIDRYGVNLNLGYDSEVHLTTITDALGRLTNINYTNGLATTVTDPFGRSATFEYDANQNLTKITDMGGYWTSLSYDQDVYLTAMINSRGTTQFNIEPADGVAANSDNYPPPGDLMWENYRITITHPKGTMEEYFYYAGCDYYFDYGCGGQSWHVSPKYYVPWSSQAVNNYRSLPPKKRYLFTSLNGNGKISSISNPDGGTEDYTYDPVTLEPASTNDSNGHTRSFTFNGKGLITSITDAKGKTTTTTYAANNVDLTGITTGLGTVSMGFDGFHNLTSVTNRLGKTNRYAYNGFGQKSSETDALNNVTSYTYYDSNHPSKYQLKEIVRDGKTLYSMTYDAVGRITTKTDPTGLTLMYTYDNLNHVTAVTYPDGKQETFVYSGCCPWLIDSYTDRAGRTTYYTYDESKRLTMVKQPDGTSVKYEYDPDGNLIKLIDPNNGATTFEYDTMSRLIKKTYADGKYERFGYDGDGLLIAKANAQDAISNSTTASYSYDENHNLTGITYIDGTSNVNYFYDDYNRLIARGDGIGVWSYAYNAESRLLSVDGPWANDTLTYTNDDIGRRTSVQLQGVEAVSYVYDALGRLTEIKPGTRTFGYVYPTNSPSPLPVSLTRPNGSVASYQYDTVNRVTELANKNSAQQLIIADAFTYNTKDMRGNETITNGMPITNFAANLATYSYNTVNQLLSTVSPSQAFTYDFNGNMTRGYTPEGYVFTAAYDAENRLKTIDYTDNASVAHHTDFYYSADGMLVRQVVDGVDTRFVRDGFLTLQERNGSNNVTRSYVWDPRAPGGIGGLLELSQSGQQYSYLFDGKGNVTKLLDGTQATTATYTYDEFGKLMVKGATLDQPFRFSTKPYDEKTGLSYYGYRFYSPVLGRWLNRDPLGENGGINLYGFVQNNPVNKIDPLGLTSLVYDNSNNTLTIYTGLGMSLGEFPSANNAQQSSRGAWDAGTYNFSYWLPHPEGNSNGPYGSNGNFVFNVPGCQGCGVHSGREDRCDRAGRCAFEHATNGCIRTTDGATWLIRNLIESGDPLTTLTVVR